MNGFYFVMQWGDADSRALLKDGKWSLVRGPEFTRFREVKWALEAAEACSEATGVICVIDCVATA